MKTNIVTKFFVNTAGAESPLSAESNTITLSTTGSKLLYAIPIEIPVGNSDVIGKTNISNAKLSADVGADGDTYYFVAEIPNNGDDFYIDDNPDTGLEVKLHHS